MGKKFLLILIGISGVSAALLIAARDHFEGAAVAPPRGIGGATDDWKLTKFQRSLSPEQSRVLESDFPEYRLPLQQDRICARLRGSINAGNVEEVDRLLDSGADVNWRDGKGMPHLFTAIHNRNAGLVKKLIQRGANYVVGVRGGYPSDTIALNQWGQTPLYFAARLGHTDIVQLLLDLGADVNAQNRRGKTAIVASIELKDERLLEVLIDNGAKLNFKHSFYRDELPGTDSFQQSDAQSDPSPFAEIPVQGSRLMKLANQSGNDKLASVVRREYQKWIESGAVNAGEEITRCVNEGETDLVREWLQRGTDVGVRQSGWSLLHLAAKQGNAELCSMLIEAGLPADLLTNSEYQEQQIRPIDLAITSGSVTTVQVLLDHGATLKPDGSALRSAVSAGRLEMAKFLVGMGESPHDPTLVLNAVQHAVTDPRPLLESNNAQLIEYLAAQNEGDVWSGLPRSVEISLCQNGKLGLLKLIESHKEIVYDDELLRASAESGDVDLCHHLVAQGASFVHDAVADEKVLRLAMAQYRNPELVEFLFQAGVPRSYPKQFDVSTGHGSFYLYGHPFYHAALAGDVAFCRYLLQTFPASDLYQPLKYESYEYDSPIEYFNPGYTPLFAAVFGDHWEVLELMLAHSLEGPPASELVDVNASGKRGVTALHEAVNYSAARCTQLLLALGADPLAAEDLQSSTTGNTVMHLAIHRRHCAHTSPSGRIEPDRPTMFPMLVAAAKVRNPDWFEFRNKAGRTPLHQFAHSGHLPICKMLVDLGADVNARDNDDATPLNVAIRGYAYASVSKDTESAFKLCQFLVDSGTELDQSDVGPHLLYLRGAAHANLFELCDYLSAKGVEPDLQRDPGNLLNAVAKAGKQEMFVELLERGADINEPDARQKTPLHYAVESRAIEMCELLLDRGADVDAADKDGRTPLFSVFDRYDIHNKRFTVPSPEQAHQEALQILQLLIDHHADVSILDQNGKSVVERYPTMPSDFLERLSRSQ